MRQHIPRKDTNLNMSKNVKDHFKDNAIKTSLSLTFFRLRNIASF